jgi:hypothetical protein
MRSETLTAVGVKAVPTPNLLWEEDAEDDENNGMPTSAIRATSIPIRIIEL